MANWVDPDLQDQQPVATPQASRFVDPDQGAAAVDQSAVRQQSSRFIDPDLEQPAEPRQQLVAASQAAPAREVGTLEALATGINRAVEAPVEGILQLGSRGAAALGINTQEFDRRLEALYRQREQDYAQAAEQHPVATRAGYWGTTIGNPLNKLAVGTNAIKGVGYLAAMGRGAAAGATGGFLQYTPEGGNRLWNTAVGAVLGGTVGGVAKSGERLIQRAKGLKGQEARALSEIRALTDDMELERAAQAQAPAQRLGTRLTLGEATGNEALLAKEGRAINQPAQQAQAVALAKARRAATTEKFDEILSGLNTPEKQAFVQDTFDNLKNLELPTEQAQKLLSNPSIRTRMEDILKDVDVKGQYEGVGPTNARLLYAVKKNIDDELYSGTSLVNNTKNLSSDAKNALRTARQQILDALDANAPDLPQARLLSQAKQFKDSLDEAVGKWANQGEDVPVETIYSRLLSKPETRDNFYKAVANSGGDVQQAKDLTFVLQKLSKSQLGKSLRRNVERVDAPGLEASARALAFKKLRDWWTQNYTKGYSRLLFDPEIGKVLQSLKKKSDPDEVANGFIRLLTPSSGEEAAYLTGQETSRDINRATAQGQRPR